jgi:transposase
MKTKLQALFQSEGYRIEMIQSNGEIAQATLSWDKRQKPRCSCGRKMCINRIERQMASDLPLGCASVVTVAYDAVQGCCKKCQTYETIRPLEIVPHHHATLRYMRHVSLLCRWLPASKVCEVVPVSPSTAARYDRYILKTELPDPCLDDLGAIIIDEKYLGKSRGFITLVLNARTGELLHLAEGRGQDALDGFFTKLTDGQKAAILAVAIDRSNAYRCAVASHLPHAQIVFDKFHIIANYSSVIDAVRRRSYHQASQADRAFIKGQRFNLLRNAENLTENGSKELQVLLEANADLNAAYVLKDQLKEIWTYTYTACAAKALARWIELAVASGIRELARFATGLERAKDEILAFCKHRITSAKIEAFNGIVARVVRNACGLSDLDYLFLKLRQHSLRKW